MRSVSSCASERGVLRAGRHGDVLAVDQDGLGVRAPPGGVEQGSRQCRGRDGGGHGGQGAQGGGQQPCPIPDRVDQLAPCRVTTERRPRLSEEEVRLLVGNGHRQSLASQ